MISGKRN